MSTKLLAGLALAAQTRAAVVEANAHDISLQQTDLTPADFDLSADCLTEIGANPGFFHGGSSRPGDVEFLLPNGLNYTWSAQLNSALQVFKNADTPFKGLDGMKVVGFKTADDTEFRPVVSRNSLDNECNGGMCVAVKLRHPDNALTEQCVQDLASLLASKASLPNGDQARNQALHGLLHGFGKDIAAKASVETNADQTLLKVKEFANQVADPADQKLSKIGMVIADKANFGDTAGDTLLNMFRDIAAMTNFVV